LRDPQVPAVRNADPSSDRRKLMRVLVVDDHDLFRAGLARLLALQPGIEVVAQASTGHMGVRLAEELHPDVVVMDLRMPDLDGFDATRAILESQPSARVVALSVSVEEVDVAAAMQAGACGFLVKDAPIDEVVVAVRAAAQGATWLSARAAEVVLRGLRRAAPEPNVGLASVEQVSPRELEVLRLIARGMENAEIGQTLSISPRTAKNHVSSILAKLRLPGRVQAATYAVRHGLD
jgi:DNA-binding NarL/FixJ family response regulator